jgi:ABC-2 type transport system permease protein
VNIFWFETKTQLKSFIIWAASLLVMFFVFLTAFYDAFMMSRSAVEKALESLPPAFAAAFGVPTSTMFTFGGFFQFIYTYVGLVGAIMAVSFALTSFSREKRSKCVDFLLVKPVERGEVFTSKLLCCLLYIVVTNILFVAAAVIAYTAHGEDASGMGKLVLASSSLFFMQLVFLSIGILFATLAHKIRSVSGMATAFGFAGFILMALHSLINEDALLYISPLTYFSPADVFSMGRFETKYVVTAALVSVVCVAVSYVKYCKSDTRAI